MPETFNVYCDESGHLVGDRQPVMVLGALWLPYDRRREVSERLREIKEKHRLGTTIELKWTKVSPSKLGYFMDVLDYFFDDDDLHFRALVIRDKSKLDHDRFDQTHDDWYYKMYYQLLTPLVRPRDRYRFYLDIKDTRSAAKVRKLEEVLRNKHLDFDGRVIERVQSIRSHEVEPMQLADFLIGAIGSAVRPAARSAAKNSIIERLKKRSGYNLDRTTLLREEKVNLFFWQPSGDL